MPPPGYWRQRSQNFTTKHTSALVPNKWFNLDSLPGMLSGQPHSMPQVLQLGKECTGSPKHGFPGSVCALCTVSCVLVESANLSPEIWAGLGCSQSLVEVMSYQSQG